MKWAAIGLLAVGCGTPLEPSDKDDNSADTGATPSPPPPPETGTDTGTGTIEPPITVELRLSGDRIEPEVQIVVSRPGGAWLATVTTGASEHVLPDIPDGSSVTEIVTTATGVRVTTVADVQDGDVLYFPGHGRLPDPVVGAYTLQPATDPPGDWFEFELQSDCFGAVQPLADPVNVVLRQTCHAGDLVDGFAWVRTATFEPVAIATGTSTLSGKAPSLTGTLALDPWQTEFAEVIGRYTHAGATTGVELRVEARRAGRPAPVGLRKSQTMADGQFAELRTPIDAAFHDELQVTVVRGAGVVSQIVVSDRSIPKVGQKGGIAVAATDLVPTPDAWSVDGAQTQVRTPLPDGWLCADEGAEILQVELYKGGVAVPVTWTWVGPHQPTLTLPELDPADDPRPATGFDSVKVQVHAGDVDLDELHHAPGLTADPGTWLSTSGKSGRVCSSRQVF